jgi:hypothetical protein
MFIALVHPYGGEQFEARLDRGAVRRHAMDTCWAEVEKKQAPRDPHLLAQGL